MNTYWCLCGSAILPLLSPFPLWLFGFPPMTCFCCLQSSSGCSAVAAVAFAVSSSLHLGVLQHCLTALLTICRSCPFLGDYSIAHCVRTANQCWGSGSACFGPPRSGSESGSISQRYGSGSDSGSFPFLIYVFS
jgi:hypothetical protein